MTSGNTAADVHYIHAKYIKVKEEVEGECCTIRGCFSCNRNVICYNGDIHIFQLVVLDERCVASKQNILSEKNLQLYK